MLWFFIALLNPVFHAFSNVLDNYFTNRLFKSVWTIIFYSTIFNAIFLPAIYFIGKPTFPPFSLFPFLCSITLIEILYLYPYYKALQNDDTSIVISLLALGKIFVPILAFLMVGETVQFAQYVGFLIVIVTSAFLTLDRTVKFKFNNSFFYMLVCSLLLSVEAVVYKYIFNQVGWSTGFFWPAFFSLVVVACMLVLPACRRDIRLQFQQFKDTFHIFALGEFLTVGGSIAGTYAISLTSVTLVKSIESLQSFCVLIYALIFRGIFPRLFKEHIDTKNVIKKFILFGLAAVGVMLVVR